MLKPNIGNLTKLLMVVFSCCIFFSTNTGVAKTHYKSAPKVQTKKIIRQNESKAINPHVLKLATKAYHKARATGAVQKNLLTIIDYSLPSTQPRLWVLDTAKNKIIYNTHVAHGSGSGGNHAQKFSDIPGSYQSSLGVFVTGKTYQGKHGLSLTLHGLEQGVNGNAERRRIVMHGAHYVNPGIVKSMGRLGRSWGCPAVSTHLATPMIQTIKDGSVIFSYYPDSKWLNKSKFL